MSTLTSQRAASPLGARSDDVVEAGARVALERGDYPLVLELLMEQYGDRIYGYCLSLLGGKKAWDLAEEAHSATFLQAFGALREFRSESMFKTWLFAIARNRCRDAQKIRGRWRRRFEQGEPQKEPASDASSSEECLVREEQRQGVRRCLEQLPPKDQEAIHQRYYAELSYPEIAAVLGGRPQAFERRVARALPRLKQRLETAGLNSW